MTRPTSDPAPRQLPLLADLDGEPTPDWWLDEATRRRGRNGIGEARRALAAAAARLAADTAAAAADETAPRRRHRTAA